MLLIGLIPLASKAFFNHSGDSFVVTPFTNLAPKKEHKSVSTLTFIPLPSIPFVSIFGKFTSRFKIAPTSYAN